MKPTNICAAAFVLAALSWCLPASAAPGGRLGTLPLGEYRCSVPGDASGPAWRQLHDTEFKIINASTYRTADGYGSYLLTGDMATFTRGPMNGMRFERVSNSTVRWIDSNGKASAVRCVRLPGST